MKMEINPFFISLFLIISKETLSYKRDSNFSLRVDLLAAPTNLSTS